MSIIHVSVRCVLLWTIALYAVGYAARGFDEMTAQETNPASQPRSRELINRPQIDEQSSALRRLDIDEDAPIDPSFPDPTLPADAVPADRVRPGQPANPPPIPRGEFRSIEQVPLWKIELETITADREDAGTDGRIRLRMKLRSGGTVDLDLEGDDRERGHTDRYVIDPWAVHTVADIEQLELYTSDDDGWCVQKVALRVNNDPRPIFQNTFSECHWLDTDGVASLPFTSSTLRSHPDWTLDGRTAILAAPSTIFRYDLERMIEGAVGHAIAVLSGIDWGSQFGRSHIEAEFNSAHNTKVDLDLSNPNGIGRAIEIDANFDIEWICNEGQLDFELSSLTTGIEAGWVDRHKGRIVRAVEDMLLRLGQITKGRRYRCTEAPLVMPDGGISISFITAPAPIVRFPKDVVDWNNQPQVISSIEDLLVWDLQLETETGDVEDAGTDDKVQLLLTEEDEPFYLDHVFDDRKRGGIDRYNVVFPNLRTVRDVHRVDLRLPRGWEDGWCVTRIVLFVNRDPTPLFTRTFASCFWIDTDGSNQTPLTINRNELRADRQWSLAGHGPNLLAPPTLLTPDYLKDHLEHAMGDRLSSNHGDTWDDCDNRNCIDVDRGSGRSFVTSLKYKTVNSLNPDDYYDINFDLGFRCVGGELKVKPRNFGGLFFSPGIDTTTLSSNTWMGAMAKFGSILENMTISHRCTADPQVIDYGHVYLPLVVRTKPPVAAPVRR